MKLKYFIYSKNLSLEYQNCNLSFAHLLGFKKPNNITGKKDKDLPFTNECSEQIHCYDKKIIKTGLPQYNLSQIIQLKNNSFTVVTSDRFPIFNNQKKIVGVFAVLVCDTRLRLVDQVFFDHILTHLPYYVFWKDKNSVYLGANSNFSKLVGKKTGAEVIGLTDYDLGWGEGEAKLFRTADKKVMESNSYQINEEEILKRSDGSEITMLVSKVPVRNNAGDTLGMVGISTEITPLKQTEQALKKAQRQAEIASDAKSEFIANMSHDLRTPITGMMGLVQDMISAADTTATSLEKQQNDIQYTKLNNDVALKNLINKVKTDGNLLLGATDELLRFCNEVLEVICLETGRHSKQIESFNFHTLVKQNIKLLQPTAQHKKLKLFYDISSDIPTFLKGLAIYLDRSLLNLISNALKFTNTGFIKVTAQLADPCIKAHHIGNIITLKITVEDTGIGIPKEKLNTIFEHFSRLTSSYQGIYKGAGLGLYTVKQYIRAMQGHITVDSEKGKGTRFTLTLPFTVSECRTPEIRNTHTTQAEQTTPNIKRANILLVEDSPLAAMAVKSLLESFACSIDIAENGTEAVNMAQNNSYHLILMDIGLPDFTGVTATKKIRAFSDSTKSKVPIVALTGHAGNAQKRQSVLESGVQEILNKPAKLMELKSILDRYVFKKINQASRMQSTSTDHRNFVSKLAVLNWQASIQMTQGAVDAAKELLSLLATELKKTAPLLLTHYTRNNMTALRDILHRLQGGVCYIKVPQLEYTLKKFHQAVKATPPDSSHLEQTHADLQRAIQCFLEMWEAKKFEE